MLPGFVLHMPLSRVNEIHREQLKDPLAYMMLDMEHKRRVSATCWVDPCKSGFAQHVANTCLLGIEKLSAQAVDCRLGHLGALVQQRVSATCQCWAWLVGACMHAQLPAVQLQQVSKGVEAHACVALDA